MTAALPGGDARPASGSGAPLAETAGVECRFGDVLAVRGVSLAVGGGEVVGLLGANGAGKTTLIRMLLGLVPPSGGAVRLFGHRPSRATRRRLGYVPQSLGLYGDLTVGENLAFGAAAYGAEEPGLEGDLAAARGRLVRDLSLGMQRRVAFAAAFARRPELLLLDEPTSGVGPLGRARLWDGIRGAAEAGAGVLVTTHHMDEAAQCDRLVVMTAGRVAAEGTMGAIVGDASSAEVQAARWADAFTALEAAGVAVALVGRRLRVPGAGAAGIRARLSAAGIEAEVRDVPATFEEVFVSLTVRT